MEHLSKILWLSPNFNHYKARFLNYLAATDSLDLTVMSGTGRKQKGDQELDEDWVFNQIKVNVSKNDFGRSKEVRKTIKENFSHYNWVLIPAEKKNLPLFLFALILKKANPAVRLFSYNHPILKSKGGRVTMLDRWITKFYFRKLDRVIFYTKQSHVWAIKNKLINSEKAFWANNTIDNTEVEKYYSFHLPPINEPKIVFIGRLIASKKIDVLIAYYQKLKSSIPELKLDIIGDGPEKTIVEQALKENQDIHWHYTLVDEAKIATIMGRASIVFIPGHSGLSINHAFAYGRPYVTLQGPNHAPELEYIDRGENGYVLDGDFESNSNTIKDLLLDRIKLEQFCNSANLKSNYLSLQKWVEQMKKSLIND
jgi:glycosyltransferase involved in cell wall biosynthesis